MDYSTYYCKYLDIDTELLKNDQFIFSSAQRNEPICFYYYHYVIISCYNYKPIISIAPQFYDLLNNEYFKKEFLLHKEYIITLLKKTFTNKLDDFNIRAMQRMGLYTNISEQITNGNEVIQLKSNHRDIYFNTISSITDNQLKEHKWNLRKKQIDQGRMFAIIDNEQLVSYAVISDISFNCGNIFVWTSQNHTGKGYGKSVTLEAVKWCNKNNILPIYLVDKKNTASINIAKSLGFITLFDEVILSKVIKTKI